MSTPIISIIIPTYGRPTLLSRCIDSVINQDYENIEVIVVDDNNAGTTDRFETEKVVQAYENLDYFHYIKHKKNKNGSAARNTGWREASGEYITFVDDDDELHKSKISRQVSTLNQLDDTWVACYTSYEIIKSDGSIQISNETREGDCYLYALMRTMFMGSGSNLMIRKKVVDEIGGYDENFMRNQDIEFLVRVLEKGKIVHVNENLLKIHQDDADRKKKTFDEIDGYAKQFLEKYQSNINALRQSDKKRVLSVISLERCRVAFSCKAYRAGISIVIKNKVSLAIVIKYIIYLGKRFIKKESYGFSG